MAVPNNRDLTLAELHEVAGGNLKLKEQLRQVQTFLEGSVPRGASYGLSDFLNDLPK